MEIIHKGDAKKEREAWDCKCCGCVFRPYREEYKAIASFGDKIFYKASCPWCGELVFKTKTQ